jgi:CTD small phosphatase-like protein 2
MLKPLSLADMSRSFKLPKKPEYKDKITVFFDLDETLVHCNDNIHLPSDILLNIKISNSESIKVFKCKVHS